MPEVNVSLQRLGSEIQGSSYRDPEQRTCTTVKLAVIGPCKCGKTFIVRTFLDDSPPRLPSTYATTIGLELHRKVLQVGRTSAYLNILDCSGQIYYRPLLRPLVTSADVFVFVFDLTRRETLHELRTHISDLVSMHPEFNGIVIGNRADLTTRRQTMEGREFAEEFRLPYVETSVTDRSTVLDSFKLICKSAVERLEKASVVAREGPVIPPPRTKKQADAAKESASGNVSASTKEDDF